MANETKLTNIINPQVMADMISAQLPNALQVSKIYKVDNTLTGKPGNTITVPQWAYIGAADDLAEGAEGSVTQMTATDKDYTVKKAVKNVVLTDEAMLSGYGDPKGECQRQLKMAIADKVDNDGVALLNAMGAGTPEGVQYVKATTPLNYDAVCDGLDLFSDEEQGGEKILLVNKAGVKALRKDDKFVDKYNEKGQEIMQTGVVGEIAGCNVLISNKLTGNKAFICKPGAITAFIKRNVEVEAQRDVLKKQTIISADEHYTCAIEDMTKIACVEYTPGK